MTAPNILLTPVSEIMKRSFINYAMYVNKHRALPDVRDGLKPVHRRILFSMNESGMIASKAYKKSARMVGNVIGKYHPHGDTSVYGAAVLMAQPFSTNHPLIDGQGNFGSIDGDNPAAMRYTEMRLDNITKEFFNDLYKETVEWRENYDGSEQEPVMLPVAFPNLLVNGVEGIAVGMGCDIPPHNLSSVIEATIALMDNSEMDTAALMAIMQAPDFPTNAMVYDLDGFANAIETGRGRVKIRAIWHEEERLRGSRIVIDELPYQVNKSRLITKIADLVRNKTIEDIVAIRDESNKKGIRIVIDVRQDGSPEVVFAQLCKSTNLETSVSYNCVVIDNGQPVLLGLKAILVKWIEFRRDTVIKRYIFDRKKALARLHLFDGFMKAIKKLDEVIALIRSSKSGAHARPALMDLLDIDEQQAQAILDMKLQKITGMELESIEAEYDEIIALIKVLDEKLASKDLIDKDIKAEMAAIDSRYGTARKTIIGHGITSLEREDLIPQEEVLVMMTRAGYVKRLPVNALSVQNRGTRGKKSMETNDEDDVRAMYQVNSHDMLLIFGASGQIYGSKAYGIPSCKLTDKGRHIKNVIEGFDEDINTVLAIPSEDRDTSSVVSLTTKGQVKRSGLSNYSGATRKGGVIGMNMDEDDSLFGAYNCQDGDTMIIVSSAGLAVHFEVDKLRMASRTSGGVAGIRLQEGESVVGAYVAKKGQDLSGVYLLCIGENGIGKRTPLVEFGVKGRGGKGMTAFKTTAKTGDLASALGVMPEQDIVMFASNGVSNRIEVEDISINGRATSGVKLMNIDDGEKIITVTASVKSIETVDGEDFIEGASSEVTTESVEALDTNFLNDADSSGITSEGYSVNIDDDPDDYGETGHDIVYGPSDENENDAKAEAEFVKAVDEVAELLTSTEVVKELNDVVEEMVKEVPELAPVVEAETSKPNPFASLMKNMKRPSVKKSES